MSKYTNRYGDVFTFEKNENGNIDWKGNFKYTRYGWDDSGKKIFVDPSGGPFIGIGQDMSLYGLKGVVSGFVDHGDYWEILIENDAP